MASTKCVWTRWWIPGSCAAATGRFPVGADALGPQPRRNSAAIAWAAVSPGVGEPQLFARTVRLSPVLVTEPQTAVWTGLPARPALPWEKALPSASPFGTWRSGDKVARNSPAGLRPVSVACIGD